MFSVNCGYNYHKPTYKRLIFQHFPLNTRTPGTGAQNGRCPEPGTRNGRCRLAMNVFWLRRWIPTLPENQQVATKQRPLKIGPKNSPPKKNRKIFQLAVFSGSVDLAVDLWLMWGNYFIHGAAVVDMFFNGNKNRKCSN